MLTGASAVAPIKRIKSDKAFLNCLVEAPTPKGPKQSNQSMPEFLWGLNDPYLPETGGKGKKSGFSALFSGAVKNYL